MGPKKGTWGVGQLVACLERRVTSVKKSNRILTHFRHPLHWSGPIGKIHQKCLCSSICPANIRMRSNLQQKITVDLLSYICGLKCSSRVPKMSLKTSQELRMLSRSPSDCRSLLLNLNLNLNRCLCSDCSDCSAIVVLL